MKKPDHLPLQILLEQDLSALYRSFVRLMGQNLATSLVQLKTLALDVPDVSVDEALGDSVYLGVEEEPAQHSLNLNMFEVRY